MAIVISPEHDYAHQLRQQVQDKVAWCKAHLNHDYELPTVTYELRGRTAGYAWYQENRIDLNAQLLIKYTEDMVNDTVPHEYAHLVSYQRYGNKGTGHGHYWQGVMWQLGLKPTRCHQYETTPARQTQKFKYVCACAKGFCELGMTRHKRTQAGKTWYICSHCNTRLSTLLPIERW